MNNLKKGLTENDLNQLANQYFKNRKESKNDKDLQTVEIEIGKGYFSLGYTIQNLIEVCQSAINSKEHKTQVHEDSGIIEVLDIAKQLIPYNELEFLDRITEQE